MPERPFTVRGAESGDIASLARFQTDTWREAYAGLVPTSYLDGVSAADRQVRWRARLEDRSVTIGLAIDGSDAIVGAASSRPTRDHFDSESAPELELSTLYVGREFRGSGAANSLLSFVIGDRSAYLWVFSANPRAIGFYRRHRFVPDGRSKVDPDTGVDELRMIRSVLG